MPTQQQQEQQQQQAITNILESLKQKDQNYIQRYLDFLIRTKQCHRDRIAWTKQLNELFPQKFVNPASSGAPKNTILFLAVSESFNRENTQGAKFNVNALINAIQQNETERTPLSPQTNLQSPGEQPMQQNETERTPLFQSPGEQPESPGGQPESPDGQSMQKERCSIQ